MSVIYYMTCLLAFLSCQNSSAPPTNSLPPPAPALTPTPLRNAAVLPPSSDALFPNQPLPAVVPTPAAPLSYPSFEFTGRGFTTFRERQHQLISMIGTSVSETQLQQTVRQTSITPNCSGAVLGIGCPSQAEVDQQVNAAILGTSTFLRPTAEEMKRFIAMGVVDTAAAIFITAASNNKGERFTFSKPIPAFPFPGEIARYQALNPSGSTWDAVMNSPRGSFNVTMNVAKISETPASVTLRFQLVMPQDTTGCVYEKFPVPREATYTIDPNLKAIQQIQIVHLHCDEEKGNHPENIQATYRLCAVTRNGQTQNFPCQ